MTPTRNIPQEFGQATLEEINNGIRSGGAVHTQTLRSMQKLRAGAHRREDSSLGGRPADLILRSGNQDPKQVGLAEDFSEVNYIEAGGSAAGAALGVAAALGFILLFLRR
jgi:hypothetical protein